MGFDANQYVNTGKALNAAMLSELGLNNQTVTICLVDQKNYEARDNKPADSKLVIEFEETEEGIFLTLNKTNTLFLISQFGSDTDGWLRKKINLIVAKTQYQGKVVDTILICEPPKPAATSTRRAPTAPAPTIAAAAVPQAAPRPRAQSVPAPTPQVNEMEGTDDPFAGE